jgi:hypothetical protein
MPSDQISASPPPPPGLPPVAPPTGKFIVQLFLVPGLIVGLIVCVLLLFNWVFGGPRSPEAFLGKLDDANTEVRWRAAADLAQVLKRDDNMAGDAGFALELAIRAERARDASAAAEKAFAERVASLKPEQITLEVAKLEPDRNYLQYLCACLGNFRVPAGVPVLRSLAEQEGGMEPDALHARRRQAVWALADLGRNLQLFDQAKSPDQDVILANVDRLADNPARREAARQLGQQLRDRRAGHHSALGVDKSLAKSARADDPFLRELTALALIFWDGSESENERMDATLLKLTYDDGHGEKEDEPGRPPEEPRSIVKSPGLRVSFNAAAALARRGSPKVRVDLLQEMLDTDRLRKVCVVRRPDGVEQPDEAFVLQTQLAALPAIAELHRKLPTLDLKSLRATVAQLVAEGNPAVRAMARKTEEELGE